MALRFLIEYVSACPPSGSTLISYELFDRLIALCAEIIVLGSISDRIRYKIDDTSVATRSGFLSIGQDSYNGAVDNFVPNYLGELIARSIKHFEEPWKRVDFQETENTDDDSHNDLFHRAFLEEFGFGYYDYQKTCGQMLIIGLEQDEPCKFMPRERLIARISAEADIPIDTVRHIVDSITLAKRDDYLKPPLGYEKWDVYPWKVNRNLSFLRKPLILAERVEEQGIFWGNRHLFNSMEFLFDHCYSGKLRARTKTMKWFISDVRNRDGKAFNDEVFDAFAKLPGIALRKRIDHFCGRQMSDAKGVLGDIDILAVNHSKSHVLVIECKNLNAAISPDEYQNELKSLFVDDDAESESAKLLRRARWIEDNIELVLTELKMSLRTEWQYQALIVTSEELFTPYLRRTPVLTISAKRLLEEFIPSWI